MLLKSKGDFLSKIGVVFSNLGTPASTAPEDVGNYLQEFLLDPLVIQKPEWFRKLLVNKIIVPRRKEISAEKYRQIWTTEGSPLLVETQRAARALQTQLGEKYKVVVAMRYGEPGFAQAQEALKDCSRIIFFPQYPHYAESTVRTSVEHFYKFFPKEKSKVIPPYFEHPSFIDAYVQYLDTYLKNREWDHLVLSFHGLPESHLHQTDPGGMHCLIADCCQRAPQDILPHCYRAQCYRTAEKITQGLHLAKDNYTVSFQSRLGRERWIQPHTDTVIATLAAQNKKKLVVACPGFPVDGLETLEEIAIVGKEQFLSLGGHSLELVPCLNSDAKWIQACVKMVEET